MARAEKRSFKVFYDLEESTSFLTDDKMGKLFRAMFGYEIRGEYPDFSGDIELETCFRFVKVTLDICNEKYQEKCEKNTENGRKGGRPPKETTSDYGGVDFPPSWQ